MLLLLLLLPTIVFKRIDSNFCSYTILNFSNDYGSTDHLLLHSDIGAYPRDPLVSQQDFIAVYGRPLFTMKQVPRNNGYRIPRAWQLRSGQPPRFWILSAARPWRVAIVFRRPPPRVPATWPHLGASHCCYSICIVQLDRDAKTFRYVHPGRRF